MKNILLEEGELITDLMHIEAFEKLINNKLPEDYKQFLLKHNGGRPEIDRYNLIEYLYNDKKVGSEADIAWFLALHQEGSLNIERSYKRFKTRIVSELISIGRGSGGDQICLGVKEGEHYGKVYFWDHENEVEEGEDPWWDNVFLIANSFTDFINSLYKCDLEFDNTSKVIKKIYVHDQYSLKYSNELKGENRETILEFFNQIPEVIEEYIIEEIIDTKEKILKYNTKFDSGKNIRMINSDGSFKDIEGIR